MDIVKYTKEYSNLTKNFDCGNIVINNFFKSDNALNNNQGIAYIMLSDEKDFIIGYYNIEVGRIDLAETIGDEVIYKPMGGTVNINYLTIHSKFRATKVAEIDGKKNYLGDIRDRERICLPLSLHIGRDIPALFSLH